MKHDIDVVQIQRVENGWVIRGWSGPAYRDGGYLPDGTMVAESPGQLAHIIREWAEKQAKPA